jgi:hypothetical protein
MIRIDDSLLEELGLIALPKADRDQLLKQIYETLEMKVGMRLAERMSDQQLDEFERFIDTNDEAGALKWLETNFPDYKQVVADELDKLKVEIKRDSPKIMEAMQANAAQTPAPAAPQQPQAPQPFPQPQPTIAGAPEPSAPPQPPVTPPPAQQPWSPPPIQPSDPQPTQYPQAPGPQLQDDSTPGQPQVPPAA